MPCGMLEASMTLRSRPPRLSEVGVLLLTTGREATNGAVTPAPKVAPLPGLIFIPFKILAMACVNFTITTPTRLTGVFHPVLGRKTSLPPNYFRLGSQPNTRHCHGYAFSSQCRTDFLTDELTNNRYLVDTWATLSIVSCSQNSSPSGPLLKGVDGQPFPSWGFIIKTAVPRPTFHIQFLASRCGWSYSGHWLLEKIQRQCFSRNQPNAVCLHCSDPRPSLACLQRPRPPIIHLQWLFLLSAALSASPLLPATTPPAAMTSFQPPAISAHVVWNPKVKSFSFSFRENQPMLDPLPTLQKIPDSVPTDVKALLQKFPSNLRTRDVKP